MQEQLNTILKELSRISSNPAHTIYSNRELQDLLKVSPKTLQKWRDEGTIGFSQVGRTILYRLTDVLDLLDGHYRKPYRA